MERATARRPRQGADGIDVARRSPADVVGPAFRTIGGLTIGGLLSMQRLAGNQAVRTAIGPTPDGRGGGPAEATSAGTVELGLADTPHPVALALARTDVRARLPRFADLKAVYTDKKLKIPEAVIKDRVAALLGRMQSEGRLKSKDAVPVIIAKIFPAAGKISETEFNKAIDVADRTAIYKSVLDTETTVKPKDRARLRGAIRDAVDLIRKAEVDAAGLTAVFGGQAGTAKARYAAARAALAGVAANMDARLTTDYNLDDAEIGVDGFASHADQHMHLHVEIVRMIDPSESKLTLIHEAIHMGDGSVGDHGYYGSPGFEAMSEPEKAANAAHYEELPRRVLGISSYSRATFKPGTTMGGGAITRDDEVRRMASDYARKAWDAALGAHVWLRNARKAALRGDTIEFTAHRAYALELSKHMNLTIHEQAPAHATVTPLDIAISESVTRGLLFIKDTVATAPAPAGPHTIKGASEVMVAAAVAHYGRLLGDPARDKALLDWLVAAYASP